MLPVRDATLISLIKFYLISLLWINSGFEVQAVFPLAMLNNQPHRKDPFNRFTKEKPWVFLESDRPKIPEFTYNRLKFVNDKGPYEFAVNPGDLRFYETDEELQAKSLNDEIQEMSEVQDYSVERNLQPVDPMHVDPQEISDHNYFPHKLRESVVRDDLKSLVQRLHENGQENVVINGSPYGLPSSDVFKKQIEINATMGMYMVALIAGVSAAITVGLIGFGIGWYTFHKRVKAAADVDYPAYGITGPNKDYSPSSGDRRLAQSAQMYHYQHQKQQIIAMENRLTDPNGALTDVDSDDDNEEGDYTVYECPGLASTGEMEVKNPLFQEDPTPATPASNNLSGATKGTNSAQDSEAQKNKISAAKEVNK